MNLHALAERVGHLESLDAVAESLADLVHRAVPAKSTRKDLLSGTWLGHPLHPLLTDIPIGSFTSASVLDLIGGTRSEWAADRLVDLGLASSVVTAVAGAADWSDTVGEERRMGVVHAASNAVGVALYGASAVARRQGKRGAATVLGLGGMSVMSFGGFLGGHLSFSRGIGVNRNIGDEPGDDWAVAARVDDLTEGALLGVEIDGAPVLLHQLGEQVTAIGGRCSHAGAPLEEGDVDAGRCTVTCPWHQSVFRLDTGEVVHGPATVPQRAYDTRVVGGQIEIRPRRP